MHIIEIAYQPRLANETGVWHAECNAGDLTVHAPAAAEIWAVVIEHGNDHGVRNVGVVHDGRFPLPTYSYGSRCPECSGEGPHSH